MQRCPEPELMNASDQVIAYAEADFSSGDHSFVERLLELIAHFCSTLPPGSLILDLGCGPGNISERLAACLPLSEVIGIDGASSMISMANQKLFCRRPAITNLNYQLVDLSHLGRESLSNMHSTGSKMHTSTYSKLMCCSCTKKCLFPIKETTKEPP